MAPLPDYPRKDSDTLQAVEAPPQLARISERLKAVEDAKRSCGATGLVLQEHNGRIVQLERITSSFPKLVERVEVLETKMDGLDSMRIDIKKLVDKDDAREIIANYERVQEEKRLAKLAEDEAKAASSRKEKDETFRWRVGTIVAVILALFGQGFASKSCGWTFKAPTQQPSTP
jgi:uncharacterized protein YlaN (UPF0358 family)